MSEPQEIKTSNSDSAEPVIENTRGEATSEERRPYQKPSFLSSQAFERQALSCAGCINQASGFPSFCSNQSG